MGVSALLHLDPNSPEAQVFYAIAQAINKISPASAPASMSPTSGFDDDNNSGWRISWPGSRNHAQIFRKRWLVLEVLAHFFVILYIFIQWWVNNYEMLYFSDNCGDVDSVKLLFRVESSQTLFCMTQNKTRVTVFSMSGPFSILFEIF